MVCGTKRSGGFQILRRTRSDRMQVTLQRVKEELQCRRHEPIPIQGLWLSQVIRGFNAYHAVPTNYRSLVLFRDRVTRLWKRALMRRGQRAAFAEDRRVGRGTTLKPSDSTETSGCRPSDRKRVSPIQRHKSTCPDKSSIAIYSCDSSRVESAERTIQEPVTPGMGYAKAPGAWAVACCPPD